VIFKKFEETKGSKKKTYEKHILTGVSISYPRFS